VNVLVPCSAAVMRCEWLVHELPADVFCVCTTLKCSCRPGEVAVTSRGLSTTYAHPIPVTADTEATKVFCGPAVKYGVAGAKTQRLDRWRILVVSSLT
jgi:hypothetical protein